MKSQFKDIQLEFLTGGVDTRSPSGSLDFATWRLLLNTDGSEQLGLCRGKGFTKYLDGAECYSNQDLHDQLLGGQTYFESYTSTAGGGVVVTGTTTGITGYGDSYLLSVTTTTLPLTADYCGTTEYTLGRQCKEAITLLHSFQSALKKRRLIAGTKSRLYASDEYGGNWRIIADGLGGPCHTGTDCTCSPVKFTAATLGQTILFANGVDYVLSWEFDTGPDGCASWSAEYVQDLLFLNVDSAELAESWNGFVFLAGIRADGEALPGRLLWSDYNDPLAWSPGGQSLAGFHDFGAGERILNLKPIGGRLRVYTTQAIYDLTQSASEDLVFNVQEIYRGPHVPIYRYSLVSTGKAHLFMSEDSVYLMSEYDREPTAFEWIHRAAGAIFSGVPASWVSDFSLLSAFGGVERSNCDQVVAGYDPVKRAVWFSWPTQGQTCPNMTMVFWLERRKASLYDHGFTAFVSHRPDSSQSIRDYLAENGLCDPSEELVAKQGSPCDVTFVDGGFEYLWNEAEDPDLPMGDAAFFEVICGLCVDDLCRECDTDIRFVMASAEDKALKEQADVYYREMVATEVEAEFPEASVATYTLDGYTTLIQGDAYRFKVDSNKRFRTLATNFTAEDQTVPSNLYAAAGYGMQADRMQWEVASPIELGAIDYGAFSDGLRAGEVPSFNFYATGSYLAYRIWTTGTGGQFCMTSLTVKLQAINNCW